MFCSSHTLVSTPLDFPTAYHYLCIQLILVSSARTHSCYIAECITVCTSSFIQLPMLQDSYQDKVKEAYDRSIHRHKELQRFPYKFHPLMIEAFIIG